MPGDGRTPGKHQNESVYYFPRSGFSLVFLFNHIPHLQNPNPYLGTRKSSIRIPLIGQPSHNRQSFLRILLQHQRQQCICGHLHIYWFRLVEVAQFVTILVFLGRFVTNSVLPVAGAVCTLGRWFDGLGMDDRFAENLRRRTLSLQARY